MWEHFKAFLRKPYDADMDALGWFMFFGLIIVISGVWAVILYHLKEATK